MERSDSGTRQGDALAHELSSTQGDALARELSAATGRIQEALAEIPSGTYHYRNEKLFRFMTANDSKA
jgi:hypothetical protein